MSENNKKVSLAVDFELTSFENDKGQTVPYVSVTLPADLIFSDLAGEKIKLAIVDNFARKLVAAYLKSL